MSTIGQDTTPLAAITGIAATSSIGTSVDEVFASLCAGRSGLAPLRGFDAARFRVQHAYEIDDRQDLEDAPGRATRWLLNVVGAAAADAGLTDWVDVPVLVGTGLRELRSAELWFTGTQGADLEQLHFGPALRERFGTEASFTIANACSASLYALALGCDTLALGHAERVVVAGVDTLTASMFGLLDRVQMEPPRRVQPFDRHRQGVLMGDGAVAVVLESTDTDGVAERAKAWVRSVAVNCDAHHVTAPDPTRIAEAIRLAHLEAGVCPESIDLVMAHGTGTLLNDEAEATALRAVFGDLEMSPVITAVKGMTGHTSGSSGLLSLVVAIAAMHSGVVPPIAAELDAVDEAQGLHLLAGAPLALDAELVQVDAFGFGGLNAVAVVERGSCG